MFLVLSFVLLATVAWAQQPHPCRSPEQFEGKFSTFDPDRKFYSTGRFAYDDRLRRFREMEEMQIGREFDFFDRLYLYNEGKEYHLNLKTRVCNVTGIHRPWIPYAVPQDARFRGAFEIGAAGVPDEHVAMNLFDGKFEDNPYIMIVTATDCIPIQMDFFSNRTGGVSRDFYDISLGISDPEAFIPPRECTQSVHKSHHHST